MILIVAVSNELITTLGLKTSLNKFINMSVDRVKWLFESDLQITVRSRALKMIDEYRCNQ